MTATTEPVSIVLPHSLAEKVFGLYLFGAVGSADLTYFKGGIFYDEISRRFHNLTRDEQITFAEQLKKGLDQ